VSQDKQKVVKKPVVKSANKDKTSLVDPKRIAKELADHWDVQGVRPRSDDFIVDSISGRRKNEISLWPSLRIQKARIIASIDSKIKTDDPIETYAEAIKKFEETQVDPVLGPRYINLVKKVVSEYFADFDYEAVLASVNDPERDHYITPGSAYPNMMAPVQTRGGISNAPLLMAMLVGDHIFDYDFDPSLHWEGIASGKLTRVPKNYKVGRMITITSRSQIDNQYPVMLALRDYCTIKSRTSHHIIQFDDQSVQHKMLIPGYVTIDLVSASDMAQLKLIEAVWPEFMQHFGYLLPKDVVSETGKIIPLTCAGTQGFPLSFTIMSILCGLIVQAVKLTNKPSSNFGDDMIVAERDYAEVYTALHALGFKVNIKKTHLAKDGFLESCGHDIRFNKFGAQNVTPVYLRGRTHVDVVQFFYQLCSKGLIEADGATGIMDRLGVEYYAFDHPYMLTEFHFPFGAVKRLPKPVFNLSNSCYVCNVPAMGNEVDSIKGLSKKEGELVLELLKFDAQMKDLSTHELTVRGFDQRARPYKLIDLQESSLYELYKELSEADSQSHFTMRRLENDYKINIRQQSFYHFITSEMYRYVFTAPTVNFSDIVLHKITLSDFIEESFGIKSETKYPIYRYKAVKKTKLITHPESNKIFDVTCN
jgi:hypothetical protein